MVLNTKCRRFAVQDYVYRLNKEVNDSVTLGLHISVMAFTQDMHCDQLALLNNPTSCSTVLVRGQQNTY